MQQSTSKDLKYADAFYSAVPDVETYHPIKEISTAEDLLNALREPQVPFTIVNMTAVTLNACPAGRFRTFCEALKHCRSIQTLTVTIDDTECQALGDALSVNRSVTRVNLTIRYLDVDVEKMLTSDTCQRLSDTLTRNHVVRKLHLTIRSNCMAIFTILGKSFVRTRNSLEVTLIVEDKLGKLEFEQLIDALNKANITALKIGYYFSSSYNGFIARPQCSAEGTQVLCDHIIRGGCPLEILKLRTPLKLDQAKQFAELIRSNPKTLKTFYYETHTTYDIAEVVVMAMMHNITIRKFLIYDVPTTEAIRRGDLFKNLLRNETIESLTVSNCTNTKSLWNDLAEILPTMTTIREIHLLASTIKKSTFAQDKDEIAKLALYEGQNSAEYVKQNHSLTKLVLDTALGSQVIPHIESALVRNRKEQNNALKDTIVIMYNIARTTSLPIDIWAHIFKYIQFYGVTRNLGNILVNIYNDPTPKRVVN